MPHGTDNSAFSKQKAVAYTPAMPMLAASEVLHARRVKPSRRAAALVSVVVPLYDEEQTLPELHRRLHGVLESLECDFEIVYVNDGSRDATPRLLDRLVARNDSVTVLHLSRNFGHQAAVSAGLDHATGDVVAVMDGDLQDSPEELPRLLQQWRLGHDVVYAIRRRRKERAWKRFCYASFYRFMNHVGAADLPLDSGDFCVMDRKAVDALARLPERSRFVRGLRNYVGFNQVGVESERGHRAAGVPKYTLRKLAGLALDGVFSFGTAPQRVIVAGGVALLAIAVALAVSACFNPLTALFVGSGIATLGGVQLLAIAVAVEYLRRILVEVKGRPAYIVADIIKRDTTAREAA
jgi:dolichol-phosphate mannosyltransferase